MSVGTHRPIYKTVRIVFRNGEIRILPDVLEIETSKLAGYVYLKRAAKLLGAWYVMQDILSLAVGRTV